MTSTGRVLFTLFAALWLPLCHCQMSQIFLEQLCCESSEGSQSSNTQTSASDGARVKNCCKKVVRTCCEGKAKSQNGGHQKSKPAAPCQTCGCCVTKAPPPSTPTIDLNLTECILPPCPMNIVLAQLSSNISPVSCWNNQPPGPPLKVNQRCAILSHWIL